MAYRTWGRVLLAALGVGLLAGAGQLGFAYGLGVVRFARDFEQSPGQWTAHLAWVAWFAMLAAVAGALAGSWLAARDDLRPTLGSRVAVSVAGGVGALAVAPLAMLPSRVASIGSGSPVTIAGLSAVLGALVGVFAAVAVLSQRVAGLNLGAVTVVVWLIALLSVAPSLGPDDPLPEVRLGVLDASWLGDGLAQRLAVIVMPAIALAAGAGIGALARWRGLPVIPVAVSGVVGPALLALAYLIAGPGDDADRYQAAPYWGALIAVAAGGLGSVLAAVARQLTAERPEPGPASRHGDHTAEVFPGYRGDDTAVAIGPKPPAARDQDNDEPTRPGFDAWGGDKPTAGGPDSRWGDDKPTSSFTLDSPPARSGDDLSDNDRDRMGGAGSSPFAGRADRDPAGGSATNTFGRGRDDRDPIGGSTTNTFGRGRDDRDPHSDSATNTFGRGRDDHDPHSDSATNTFGRGRDDRDPIGGSTTNTFGRGRDDRDPHGEAGSSGGGRDDVGSRGTATGRGGDTFGGRGDEPLGGAGSGAFGGSGKRDTLGGRSVSAFGGGAAVGRERAGEPDRGGGSTPGGESEASRASHLGDIERPGPSRAGARPAGGSLFNPPTPVAPPRQPEIVSPPPVSEPTPVRPFNRQPAAGPGDWRTDGTSTFSTPSVPVVPANGPERRDDGDGPQRPTSIRPQPSAGRVPQQSGEADGLAPIDLPAQPGTAWPAAADPAGRPRQAGPGRHGPGRSADPAQTSGAGSSGWSDRSGWSGGPTPPAGRPATTGGPAETSTEMPDWRLAPPAWTPPPPLTPGEPPSGPGEPPSGPGARADAAPAEAVPAEAPEQKRRGLFRRKKKSEPPATAETSHAGWVEVAAPAGSAPDEQSGADDRPAANDQLGTDDQPTGDNAPGGSRGFGFGRLVSGRFGGDDQTAQPAGSWADRDTAADGPRRDAGTFDRDDNPRFGGDSETEQRSGAGAFGRDATARFGGADPRPDAGTGAGDSNTLFGGGFDRDTDARSAGHGLGASDSATGAQDESGRRSWADRARAGDDPASSASTAAGDTGAPAKGRAGKKPGRAERHLRSVDLGDDQPARPAAHGDSDAGSWDIDDPTPPTRGSTSGDDDAETDDAHADAEPTPSRGLFRRNRNNPDTAETRTDQAGDDAPEPSRGRRGKGDKPIQERDEEYVDWVTGLSAPEPVNERRRDDVPRRSLRSTTRRKDE